MAGAKRRLLSLPVLGVALLMGFVFYVTVFVFIEDRLGLQTSAGFLNALLFSWICFMSSISFLAAVILDPGRVPSSFTPETEDPQKDGMNSKFCSKCKMFKPPRTHHCRVCKRCVLKMDHHCTWISNCVGYKNYKPFLICVLHAAIGSTYSLVIFITSVLIKDHDYQGVSNKLFYILSGSVLFISSLALGSLLVWHVYLLAHNMTTIEYREAVRAMWLAKKSGYTYHHPFDLRLHINLVEVLGQNILKWLCPTALSHLKDGTKFPVAKD